MSPFRPLFSQAPRNLLGRCRCHQADPAPLCPLGTDLPSDAQRGHTAEPELHSVELSHPGNDEPGPVKGPESPRVPGRNKKHHQLQTLAESLGTWGASTYAVTGEHALQEGSGKAQARGPQKTPQFLLGAAPTPLPWGTGLGVVLVSPGSNTKGARVCTPPWGPG